MRLISHTALQMILWILLIPTLSPRAAANTCFETLIAEASRQIHTKLSQKWQEADFSPGREVFVYFGGHFQPAKIIKIHSANSIEVEHLSTATFRSVSGHLSHFQIKSTHPPGEIAVPLEGVSGRKVIVPGRFETYSYKRVLFVEAHIVAILNDGSVVVKQAMPRPAQTFLSQQAYKIREIALTEGPVIGSQTQVNTSFFSAYGAQKKITSAEVIGFKLDGSFILAESLKHPDLRTPFQQWIFHRDDLLTPIGEFANFFNTLVGL